MAVTPAGSKAYVGNYNSNTVSVINTATNTVTATVTVGNAPYGVAVTPDGSYVYVTNAGFLGSGTTVSVINTATNTVTATVTVGNDPMGVAVTPDGSKVYVTNEISNTVSVINTATNTVTATVNVGSGPLGVAVTPDGSKVYVANNGDNTVSVISTASNAVTATVTLPGGSGPRGVAVTPDGSKVYVANWGSNTVSVINTATNTVTGIPIPVGNSPVAFGQFILPPPQTPTPVITTPIQGGATSVSGTSAGSARISLTVNGGTPYTTTASASGAWTVAVPALAAGNTIAVSALVTGDLISTAATATVVAPTPTPASQGGGSSRTDYWVHYTNTNDNGYTGPEPTQVSAYPVSPPVAQQTANEPVTAAATPAFTEPPLPTNTPRSGIDAVPVIGALGLCGVIVLFRKNRN
jgi:YVTN family beta-propeller protein